MTALSPISRVPDFLIIGAMKCGTTSLHRYLGLHPDVHTTTKKELHYFNNTTLQDDSWERYLEHFQTSAKLAGASPLNYTKRHQELFSPVPAHLYSRLPQVKLIYLLRDPIERIYSHYYEAQEGGYAPKGGLNALLQEVESNNYVLTSSYFYQLSAFLDYFPRNQICLLTLEQLRDHRLETLNTVFRFLGVSELRDETPFQFRANRQSDKTRVTRLGMLAASRSLDPVRKIVPQAARSAVTGTAIFRRMTRTPHLDHEKIHPDLESRIRDVLREDVNQLRKWSHYDFPEWSL